MSQDQLKAALDDLRARLHAELDAQLTAISDQQAQAVEAAKRATEADADARLSARLEETRAEWESRLESERTAALEEAERRVADETARVRLEVEQAAAESASHLRQELEQAFARERDQVRGELEQVRAEAGQVRGELEQARAEAGQARGEVEHARVEAEAFRARVDELSGEIERVRRESGDARAEFERVRNELDSLRAESERLRSENEGLREETERIRVESDHARTVADEDLRRFRAESDEERRRTVSEAESRQQQVLAELESERRRAEGIARELDQAQAALAEHQEQARAAADAIRDAQTAAVAEGRVAERQSAVALVERLLGSVRTIGTARSLSETLGALVTGGSAEAPRVALFIVNGPQLQGWKAVGFSTGWPPPPVALSEAGVLGRAMEKGETVSTATEPAPSFAGLSAERVGLAVPIVVGGQTVAVLYADDESVEEPQAPASWPEAMQILGRHASVCLAHLTALRTAQAMRAAPGTSPAARAVDAGSDDESSARRYARLLVSEIKLYNEVAVRLGREKRDLLDRLRPEIDRARRLYEERVPPAVGARGLYFQQELVQTLADGDPALLGGSVGS